MDASLLNLLNGHKTDGSTFSHVTLRDPKANWLIKGVDMANFWANYCKIVYSNNDKVDNDKFSNDKFSNDKFGNDKFDNDNKSNNTTTSFYCLAENTEVEMPFVAELSFIFNEDVIEVPYDDTFILAIVQAYQKAINETLEVSDENGPAYICCVLEADEKGLIPPVLTIEGKKKCIQVRLQFPYCRVDKTFQSRVLQPKAIQILQGDSRILSSISDDERLQPIVGWDKIVNVNITDQPLLMYKGTISPKHPQLLLSHIYGFVTNDHISSGQGPNCDLSSVFVQTNHRLVQHGVIQSNMFHKMTTDLMYWLPMFLSTNYWGNVTLPKKSVLIENNENTPQRERKNNTNNQRRNMDVSDLDIASELLHMLSQQRVDTDCFWIDIGRALYNCDISSAMSDPLGERGLRLWIQFTERSDSHSAEDCKTYYPTFKDSNNITIKTIAWYAREDNIVEYNKWHKKQLDPLYEQATSCTHSDVAAALYRTYWLDFTCSSIKGTEWYYFMKHRWIKQDSGVDLRKIISGDFRKRFEKLRVDIALQIQESNSESMKLTGELMLKKIGVLITKLGSVTFKNMIMKEASEPFYNPKFSSILNASPNLMGNVNCVFEVLPNSIEPRNGKPEDYVSRCTGIVFPFNMDWKNSVLKELLDWIHKAFPDKELAETFLRWSASVLKGKNSEKLFPMWTGPQGNNSKSLFVKLFVSALGDYCIKYEMNVVSGKKAGAGAPLPEIVRSQGTRLAFLQEPDATDELNGGTVKLITGGDSRYARGLYSEGGDIEVLNKIVLMCNRAPFIPNSDSAVRNRLQIWPFLSIWAEDAPIDEKEQWKLLRFKMDPFFDRNIPRFAPVFLWLMVQKFPDYCKMGIGMCDKIEKATLEYWKCNDVYGMFTDECVRTAEIIKDGKKITNSDAKVTLAEIYQAYKMWFIDTFPKTKTASKNIVKMELELRWGKLSGSYWYGIKLVEKAVAANI